MPLNKIASSLIILISTVGILLYIESLMIPFILALLIWFLITEIRNAMKKITFVEKHFPNWSLSFLATMVIFAILSIIVTSLTSNIQNLTESMPVYEKNVAAFTLNMNEIFNIDLVSMVDDFSGNLDFSTFLKSLFSSLTELFGNAFMILIYVMFLLLEESFFYPKLKAMYPDSKKFSSIDSLISEIRNSISRYVSLKTIVSLSTGILSFIVLRLVGLESPMFWAFLIFLFNYIPTLGSIIATLFPAAFALFQFGDYVPTLTIFFSVGFIQVLIGNVLEPRIMGKTLNLSALVVILSLMFWGTVWGIPGMILSVPITVIMVMIFARFETTRPIAIMMSAKGRVGALEPEESLQGGEG